MGIERKGLTLDEQSRIDERLSEAADVVDALRATLTSARAAGHFAVQFPAKRAVMAARIADAEVHVKDLLALLELVALIASDRGGQSWQRFTVLWPCTPCNDTEAR